MINIKINEKQFRFKETNNLVQQEHHIIISVYFQEHK